MPVDFYRLSNDPFRMTPDPGFYFASRSHDAALQIAHRGLGQGEGVVVVTGGAGSGKSILAAHLLALLDRSRLTVAHIVSSRLSGGELVSAVGHAFGLDMESVAGDKPAVLTSLEAFLFEEARIDRRCLLVIDEAQNLSVDALEELRMLTNFQMGLQPLLQVLLLGQPDLRVRLDATQLSARIVGMAHLTPMTADEVRAYVAHRLAMAGWHGDNPVIDPRLYPEIALASGGIPGDVNRICGRLLHQGGDRQQALLDPALFQEVVDDLSAFHDEAEKVASSTAPQAVAGDPGQVDRIAAALTMHDELIAELQQAIVELAELQSVGRAPQVDSGYAEQPSDTSAEVLARLLGVEARSFEQEQTLRHTLTMLIEWIEADAPRRAA